MLIVQLAVDVYMCAYVYIGMIIVRVWNTVLQQQLVNSLDCVTIATQKCGGGFCGHNPSQESKWSATMGVRDKDG